MKTKNNIHKGKYMLAEIAKRHYEWVKQMNWHESSTLTKLGLIGSEIGESSDECRGLEPTLDLKFELADIVLRIIALTEQHNITLIDYDIDNLHALYGDKFKGLNTIESLAVFSIPLGKAVSTHMSDENDPLFWDHLLDIISYTYLLADSLNIDLNEVIQEKITKNINRGSKGRLV